MERLRLILNCFNRALTALTIFAKRVILDIDRVLNTPLIDVAESVRHFGNCRSQIFNLTYSREVKKYYYYY